MSSGKKKSSKSGGSSAQPISETHPIFHGAIQSFLEEETACESSIIINDAVEAIGKLSNLKDIFELPLQRNLLSMDGALHWAMFLTMGPTRAVEEGDPEFTHKFSVADAMALIVEVYDRGVESTVYTHFEPDEEDEEEDEEAEGEDE